MRILYNDQLAFSSYIFHTVDITIELNGTSSK